MTAFIVGVITNKGRETLAKSFGNVGGFSLSIGSYFKIGEGGFTASLSGNIPKPPDPSLTDIEAASDPSLFEFTKSFVATDVIFIAPSTIQFRCRLLPNEANDDGFGNPPKFFEIGIFDSNNNMIGYATFDEQTKNASKTLTEYIQIYF